MCGRSRGWGSQIRLRDAGSTPAEQACNAWRGQPGRLCRAESKSSSIQDPVSREPISLYRSQSSEPITPALSKGIDRQRVNCLHSLPASPRRRWDGLFGANLLQKCARPDCLKDVANVVFDLLENILFGATPEAFIYI